MYVLSVFVLFLVTAFLYIYQLYKKSYSFFDHSKIPYNKPEWIFGNTKDMFFSKKPITLCYQEGYEKLEPHPLAGIFMLHKPFVMIRDPELLKNILVRDFSYFCDRMTGVSKEADPFARQLTMLTGEEWKNLRAKLTSTFSSGKIKAMFSLVMKCAEDVKPALEKLSSHPEGFEIKDMCFRYTTDVTGSCAFGIETHSLQNPDNELRLMGKQIFDFRWQALVRFLFPKISDKLVKLFGLQILSSRIFNYFMNIVKETVKYREDHGVTRGDFLDQLIALRNSIDSENSMSHNDHTNSTTQTNAKHEKSNIDMSIESMTAQSFLFFAGGLDTTASAISFLIFELSRRQDIQNEVRDEITRVLEGNNGVLTYEILGQMPYLDMAIAESLRLWPPLGVTFRTCVQSYKVPNSDIIIKEGTSILIPIQGLHMDKKYYERPDEFYPEHFTEEAKSSRPHYTYLPFGDGPRNCIAERFAKMVIKIGVVHMLKDFTFELSPKTKLPLEIVPTLGSFAIKNGIWLKCKPISCTNKD